MDNMQAASVFKRMEANVELSDSDGDNFTRNLITMRCETRVGVAVMLPAGIISGALLSA
jgi:hypothetical protein